VSEAPFNAMQQAVLDALGKEPDWVQQGMFMIPKSSDLKRLEENHRAASITISEEEIQEINRLNRGKRVYTDPDNNPWGIFQATNT